MKAEGFADLHQHVLWGMDDGPRTPAEMEALLAQDQDNGIRRVYATSHAYPAVRPFDLARYRERLEEANALCRSRSWPLCLLPGCEIYYCSAVPDELAAGRLPTLGGSRRVLIEFDPKVSVSEIGEASNRLYLAGFEPILAHVERYSCLVRSPGHAMELREECGLLYQMNCDTILRPHWGRERRFVRKLLEARAIDVVATDAHDTVRRPVRMQEAYRQVLREQGREYADQLVSPDRKWTGEGRAGSS